MSQSLQNETRSNFPNYPTTDISAGQTVCFGMMQHGYDKETDLKASFMIAVAKTLLKYLVRICAIMVAALLVALVYFNWAAANREVTGFGKNLPADGYLLPTGEGKFFLIDINTEAENQLLFVHGTGAWSALWRPTLETAATQGYRTTAFDLPPFGWSEHASDRIYSRARQAERIIALLEELGTRPIVVAHSFGAGPMAEAVLLRPDLVSGMIVVNGAIGLGSHKDPNLLPFPLRSEILRQYITAATASNPLLTKSFLRSFIHVKEASSPEIVTVLQMPMVRVGYTKAVTDWMPNLFRSPAQALSTREENWRNLEIPIVFIWGREDTVTPLSQGEELDRLVNGADLLVLDGVGHVPQIEAPEAFQTNLLKALNLIQAANNNEGEG